jgi:putative SOS response-associated peptidase YedK
MKTRCGVRLSVASIIEHNPPHAGKSSSDPSMCGRFTLRQSSAEVRKNFDLDAVPAFDPRYNIAPTQSVLALRRTAQLKEAVFLRWGLVPSWASDLSIGNRLINARAETITEKPSFRAAFQRRRCLIVADGFYEWQSVGGKKQPIHFRFRDGRLFTLAGLWEKWPGAGGPPVESCTILTTNANELVQPLHERMPVILGPEHRDEWLNPNFSDTIALQSWLTAWSAEEMTAVTASMRVNNPRNEGPDCLEAA